MSRAERTALEIDHPGQVFKKRILERHGITVTTAAAKLFMKREQLSRFINGRTSVSKELAQKLEIATHISAEYWLSRQLDYDLQRMALEKQSNPEAIKAESLFAS